MTRLQKKCYLTAMGFHLLLLVVLLVGPAFLASRQEPDTSPILEFIPLNAKMTDGPTQGGGTPNVPPPAATPTPTPPTPAPPAEPPKTLIQRLLDPTPPTPDESKDEPKEDPKPEPKKITANGPKVTVKAQDVDNTRPAVKKIEVSATRVKRTVKNAPTTKATDDTEADERANERAIAEANRIRRNVGRQVIGSLATGLSSSTSVTMPGPGGQAYVNYMQYVKSMYTHAWNIPDEIQDNNATIKVSVTIARDGTVIDAHIVKESGDSAADRSIRDVLRAVKNIGQSFPESSKDDQKTFTISFNVKAKRMLG